MLLNKCSSDEQAYCLLCVQILLSFITRSKLYLFPCNIDAIRSNAHVKRDGGCKDGL